MDGFRAIGDDDSVGLARNEEPAHDAPPPSIGSDERRMHVRAYNYWVSLLDGRAYPSIEDLEPQNIDDFGPHSVLLDFTAGSENPAVAYLGRALREACGGEGDIRSIADVPSRSLLSRLTDHYLQIIANCAPIGFEAEFVGQNARNTMYRGILMPLSSDGDTIDFIYGVINWKEVVDGDTAASIAREAERVIAKAPALAGPVWADGPHHDPQTGAFPGLVADEDEPDLDQLDLALAPDAGLADRLAAARDLAEAVKQADTRSRSSLYRALGQAYDFALAAEAEPEDYAEMLDDAGLKAQARAPMTPIVKLVFGADYDKTRLTEFAAGLAYARRQDIGPGGLAAWLDGYKGGLKGVVAAERAAKRPEPRPDRGEEARAELRAAPALATVDIAGEGEFVLLVARREPNGRLAILAPVAEDRALIDRAIQKRAA